MTAHEAGPERDTRWLAGYLTAQPGRVADSAEIRAAASRDLGRQGRNALQTARQRLGVVVTTGSLPGRPFVTWWSLPEGRPLTELPDSDRADAERLAFAVRTDAAMAREMLGNLRPVRVALALAVILAEERAARDGRPSVATETPDRAESTSAPSEITGDPTEPRERPSGPSQQRADNQQDHQNRSSRT